MLTLGTFKSLEKTQSGLVGIGNSGQAGEGTGSDADLYVINLGFGDQVGPARNLSLFAAYLIDREASLFPGGGGDNDEADLLILGATAGFDVANLRINGEFNFLTGSLTVGGTEVDLEGMNLVLGTKLNIGLPLGIDLIYASGDDPGESEINVNGINGNYPVGVIITNIGARSLAQRWKLS